MPSSPFDELQDRPELLARFIDAYRGSHDPLDALRWYDRPDLPGPSGAPGPAARRVTLRAAVYGPTPLQDAAQRLAALEDSIRSEGELTAQAVRVAWTPGFEGSPSFLDKDAQEAQPASGRRDRRPIGALSLLAGASLFILGVATDRAVLTPPATEVAHVLRSPTPTPTPAPASLLSTLHDAVAHDDGTLAPEDYYRWTPAAGEGIPEPAGGPQSFRDLHGAQALRVRVAPSSRFLVLFVACSASGRSWRATVAGGGGGHGECGSLAGVLIPLRSATPRVTVRIELENAAGFAVSVYQH